MTLRDRHMVLFGLVLGVLVTVIGSFITISLQSPKVIVKPGIVQQTALNLHAINGVFSACNKQVPSHLRNDAWWQCVTKGLDALDRKEATTS